MGGRKKSTRSAKAAARLSEQRISEDILNLVQEQEGDQSPDSVNGKMNFHNGQILIYLFKVMVFQVPRQGLILIISMNTVNVCLSIWNVARTKQTRITKTCPSHRVQMMTKKVRTVKIMMRRGDNMTKKFRQFQI